MDALWQRQRRLFPGRDNILYSKNTHYTYPPPACLMNATFKAQHNILKNEHFNISSCFCSWGTLIWMLWTFPLEGFETFNFSLHVGGGGEECLFTLYFEGLKLNSTSDSRGLFHESTSNIWRFTSYISSWNRINQTISCLYF